MSQSRPCVLILTDIMAAGGMERQIIELLSGLKRNGHYRLAFGVLDHGGSREPEAAELAETFLSTRRKTRYDVTPVVSLIRQAKAANCRLIHALGWMSGIAGLLAARWLNIPIINGSIREAPQTLSLRQRISRWFALHSDVIVANSRAGVCSYNLCNHPKACVIHNGIDFKRFEMIKPSRKQEQTICMVANFSQNKDQIVVIQAMPSIINVFPMANLILVGRDMGTLSRNLQLVKELSLEDRVRFVADSIHPEPIIAESDICVLASTNGEGVSNAILEYMALGKPVIATNFPGNMEVIRNGETGLLVPAHSSEAIAERIIELLSSPSRAAQIAEASQRWVREAFFLDRMVAEYEELYDRLLCTRTS